MRLAERVMLATRRLRRPGPGQALIRSAVVWGFGFALLAFPGAHRGLSARAGADGSFLTRPEEPLTQYRALRRMHARSERFNQEGWLDAWTEYDRRGFRYEIVSERGSDSVRTKVLRAVLKREQELVAAGEDTRADLTSENYEFEEAAGEGRGNERYVRLKPKRRDVLLVDGRMVLSSDGTELLRVEGRLAKNPSFWTSLVNVIRHYARLDGVRVPISTESNAKLKFVGLSYLDVRYEYETINGHRVSQEARRTIAPVIER
jgi:hypothetical protein